jgi:hypothetical protein
MPDFHWETLPTTITRADLPALITLQTITAYLRQRLDGANPS